jgi:hypothetical protein
MYTKKCLSCPSISLPTVRTHVPLAHFSYTPELSLSLSLSLFFNGLFCTPQTSRTRSVRRRTLCARRATRSGRHSCSKRMRVCGIRSTSRG